jgi:hypothetical protein
MTHLISARIAQELKGETCSNVRFVAGGTLILYFGDSTNDSRQTVWIECAWRLLQDGKVLTASLNEYEQILECIPILMAQRVQEIGVGNETPDLMLNFSGDLSIQSFCNATDVDQWELRKANGRRIGVGKGLVLGSTSIAPKRNQP